MRGYKTRTSCKSCYSPLISILDLGSTPLADAFVTTPNPEQAFPLRIGVCANCKLVQMLDDVDKELLFNNDYAFFTGGSPSSLAYFQRYAEEVMQNFPNDGLHVEIAGNDGTLLKHFVEAGKRTLNIDPAGNTVEKAIAAGVPSLVAHFSKDVAEEVVTDHGKANIIMANNVVAHVDDLHDFLDGVSLLLNDDGVFIAEVQYFPHLLFNNAFDHIYHEHRSFFSLAPLLETLAMHSLTVTDVQQESAQGGSIRVFARKNAFSPVHDSVYTLLNYETRLKLDDLTTYQGFQPRVDYTKEELLNMLDKLKSQGKTVYGFGASAKGNTLLNYCGITTEQLPYIVDLTEYKIGKLTPGTHIPVVHPDSVPMPDYYLLLVWNYLPGVLARNQEYLRNGGHFIVPIPTPIVI